MNKKLLKSVLEVTTISGKEDNMVDFITRFGIKNGIPVIYDVYGNVYLKKGVLSDGESYPCVVAHMDTVHFDQKQLVIENRKIKIHEDESDEGKIFYATHPDSDDDDLFSQLTGVGGDDKAGIAICLDLILKHDKIIGAFFKEEETGCHGSQHLDTEVLKDIGYAIQFDAPGNNWVSYVCNGVQLFNKDFYNIISPLFKKYDVDNIRSYDPFTDIHIIKQRIPVNCLNLFAGYINMHTKFEYVVIDYVKKSASLANKIIKKLGYKLHQMEFSDTIIPLSKITEND